MKIGGIDPMDCIRASFAAVEQVANNLRRSANVGIGFAFSAKHISQKIALLKPNNCL